MLKVRVATVLLLATKLLFGQLTPNQVLQAGAAWQAVPSSLQLQMAQVALLSLIASGSVLTPNQVLSQAASWGAVTSDIQLLQAQAWLLSSIQTNLAGGFGNSSPNVLVQPTSWYSASDWNPIVVFGAGTSAANGSYYQATTNTVSGLPYAVWTNSTGSSYRLVLNNTNFVPSSIFSNLWTIESTINVNFAYDLAGPTVPFGTWEVSGLGGTPGSVPIPSFNPRPPIIVASSNAANNMLTLSPGVYDNAGYIWYPTNLTVIAVGAVINSMNGVKGLQPVGSFQMIGGNFTNGAYIAPGTGAVALGFDTSTNYVSLFLTKMFGPTDTLSGTIPSDNFTLSVISSELSGWWDVATFAKAANLSNVVFTTIGSKYISKTNGISSGSVLITPGANQTMVVGCYLEQGLGFTAGAGLAALNANTTNEINGSVIIVRGALPKIQQSAGVVLVDGQPYDVTDYSGTIKFSASVFFPTNLMAIANAPDFKVPVSIFSTNSVVQFQACTNVDASKRYYQECMVWVTNTIPATPRAIIAPVNCTTNGRALSIPFVTNLSRVVFRQYGQAFTNMSCEPIF